MIEDLGIYLLRVAVFLASLCIIWTFLIAITGVLQMHCEKDLERHTDRCYLITK